jgi:hypothetical protein
MNNLGPVCERFCRLDQPFLLNSATTCYLAFATLPCATSPYLYICDTSSNFTLDDYDIYDNFTTFGNLDTMSMVLVHVGNVWDSYKSSSPRVATSPAIITFMYLFIIMTKLQAACWDQIDQVVGAAKCHF